MRRAVVSCSIALASCSDPEPAPPSAPPPAPTLPADAGVTVVAPPEADDPDPAPEPTPGKRKGALPQVDIELRSTPTDTNVYIDGQYVGDTPMVKTIDIDNRAHTFKFTKSGYADAQYRFIPKSAGVVHARLEPTPGVLIDAGVPQLLTPADAAPPPPRPPVDAAPPPSPDAAVPVDAGAADAPTAPSAP